MICHDPVVIFIQDDAPRRRAKPKPQNWFPAPQAAQLRRVSTQPEHGPGEATCLLNPWSRDGDEDEKHADLVVQLQPTHRSLPPPPTSWCAVLTHPSTEHTLKSGVPEVPEAMGTRHHFGFAWSSETFCSELQALSTTPGVPAYSGASPVDVPRATPVPPASGKVNDPTGVGAMQRAISLASDGAPALRRAQNSRTRDRASSSFSPPVPSTLTLCESIVKPSEFRAIDAFEI